MASPATSSPETTLGRALGPVPMPMAPPPRAESTTSWSLRQADVTHAVFAGLLLVAGLVTLVLQRGNLSAVAPGFLALPLAALGGILGPKLNAVRGATASIHAICAAAIVLLLCLCTGAGHSPFLPLFAFAPLLATRFSVDAGPAKALGFAAAGFGLTLLLGQLVPSLADRALNLPDRAIWLVASLLTLLLPLANFTEEARPQPVSAPVPETAAPETPRALSPLNVLAHEFRTPLNAMIGFADVMDQEVFGPLPAQYKEYARDILSSGHHLLEMVNRILGDARARALGEDLPAGADFDLGAIAEETVNLLHHEAERAGVSLGLKADASDLGPLRVSGEAGAMRQVLLNLMGNALKFTPSGGSVVLALSADAQRIEACVLDTGPGIAPETLARLGDAFERGDQSDPTTGTGLGLTITRQLIDDLGGQLRLESTLGFGTKAIVSLPRAVA